MRDIKDFPGYCFQAKCLMNLVADVKEAGVFIIQFYPGGERQFFPRNYTELELNALQELQVRKIIHELPGCIGVTKPVHRKSLHDKRSPGRVGAEGLVVHVGSNEDVNNAWIL